ncbi:hypothetical protein [Streptomyces sp. MB09-02B]|uniref:hypothetical protein n=1 Tax=Streptomyces sp. MB09-02B TaxID=3028667 RepID=UPI0029B725C4|nr:hypothetical protein [Streptomyces sp. MB09-02B]MDX3641304.1 hypothetical protein [Streptomyces sp. MB09-02B]
MTISQFTTVPVSGCVRKRSEAGERGGRAQIAVMAVSGVATAYSRQPGRPWSRKRWVPGAVVEKAAYPPGHRRPEAVSPGDEP